MYRLLTVMMVMASALLLSGCGGGDGGAASFSSSLKGIWAGTAGNVVTKAIVLANGEGWFIFGNAQNNAITFTFCDHVQMTASNNSFMAQGTQYLLQNGTSADATGSGTFVEKTFLTGSLSTSTFTNLVYDSSYEKRAVQSDIGGSWSGAFGGGASSLTLTVNGTTGEVSGESSNKCSYGGSAQPRSADPALFDVNLTETCLTGTPTELSGIAYTTAGSGATYVSIVVTTADRSDVALFVGQKQ